ncbi:FRG domain-containing protein [Microbacterium sp. 67-17]|uniref:FRG domain-containing protein n=1 Tax=Microbacterium sp. 67-17 TaxID=1895782 RepID=UPI000A3E5B21|nr:FRG domain-containing protein [Microbacterium sp. 67-17]
MPGTLIDDWKRTGWWIQPKTAREVMAAIGSIGVYSTGQHFAWRGMSSADYDLSSSLHRQVGGDEEQLRTAEIEILGRARKWGLGVESTGYVDDLQLLSDLQHYGIATRLIDFTSNPMTALWFACQTPKSPALAKAGLLLALNTTAWERVATVRSRTLTVADLSDPNGATLRAVLRGATPVIVESPSPNARLRAQEGFFVTGPVPERERVNLVHGFELVDTTPFKSLHVPFQPGNPEVLQGALLNERNAGRPPKVPFVAVIVSSPLKTKLLRYLEGTYNRSARTLFPDFAGFKEFDTLVPTRPGVV